MKPDVIHVSCPGLLVNAAVLYSRMLGVPLVVSYHTHIPYYIPRYTWSGLVAPMWAFIRWWTRCADLTLVTSKVMKDELSEQKCEDNIHVWQRGVDTDVFNPKFKNEEMRFRMTDGHPEAPLLVHVGRLGSGEAHPRSLVYHCFYCSCLSRDDGNDGDDNDGTDDDSGNDDSNDDPDAAVSPSCRVQRRTCTC